MSFEKVRDRNSKPCRGWRRTGRRPEQLVLCFWICISYSHRLPFDIFPVSPSFSPPPHFFSGLWFGKFSSFPSLEYETVLTGWLAGFHFPEKVKGVFTFQRKWKCNWKLFCFCHYCCFCVICVSAWGRKYLINVSKLLPASTDMKSKNIYFTKHGIFTLPNFVSNCKTASFTMFC